MHVDLNDLVVLVTGASRGIGTAIARQMAASGATVAVHYNTQRDPAEALASSLGHGARPFQADVADVPACERLWNDVIGTYGRVDVLVNNAAVAFNMPPGESTAQWQQAWDLTMAVNLRAPELLCRLAVAHFQTRGGGRIINVASRAAFRGDTPEYFAYAESKGGLVALSRSIARAYGKAGVKAFVVAPGFTRTDMAHDFLEAYGEDHLVEDLALDTLTEPRDVAPLVTFLASGLADHATGGTFDVNAGSYVH